jgi:hypothetical protein
MRMYESHVVLICNTKERIGTTLAQLPHEHIKAKIIRDWVLQQWVASWTRKKNETKHGNHNLSLVSAKMEKKEIPAA